MTLWDDAISRVGNCVGVICEIVVNGDSVEAMYVYIFFSIGDRL